MGRTQVAGTFPAGHAALVTTLRSNVASAPEVTAEPPLVPHVFAGSGS